MLNRSQGRGRHDSGVLVFAPVTADNLVDVQELFIVDTDLQSLDVGCKCPMEIQVVGKGSPMSMKTGPLSSSRFIVST